MALTVHVDQQDETQFFENVWCNHCVLLTLQRFLSRIRNFETIVGFAQHTERAVSGVTHPRMEPRQDGLQAMFPGCCCGCCCCCGTLQVLSSPTPPSPQFSLAVAPCIHDTRRYLAFLMYFRCLLSEAVSEPFTHSVRGLICLILGLRSGGNNTKWTVEKSVVETQHDALI